MAGTGTAALAISRNDTTPMKRANITHNIICRVMYIEV